MLNHPRHDTEGMDVLGVRLVDLGILLGGEEDLLVGAIERPFQGHHRRLTADHEGGHHVGIDHHVPQGNGRQLNESV